MPRLISQEQAWATTFELYDTGFSSDFNRELADEILNQETKYLKTNDGPQIGNFPPFSSLYKNQRMKDWPHQQVTLLVDALHDISSKYLSSIFGADCHIRQLDVWANIHRASNWHGPHSHFAGGGETISGVYWVLCPTLIPGFESNGALVFPDSRGPYHPGRHRKVVTPMAGHAIVFPAWQQHYVTPIEPGSLRLSVGFDALCDRVVP